MIQMDVFNTFIELLRQTGNVTKGQTDTNKLRQVHGGVSLIAKFMYCFLWICIKKFLDQNFVLVFFRNQKDFISKSD